MFSHADFNDEETGFAGPFTGSFNADGIAISADGTTWFPVFNAPSQSTGVWMEYEIDLAAALQPRRPGWVNRIFRRSVPRTASRRRRCAECSA